MTTYDGTTGKEVKITPAPPLEELEEVTITAKRPRDWSGLVYALLAGVVVFIVDDLTGKKTRRRR